MFDTPTHHDLNFFDNSIVGDEGIWTLNIAVGNTKCEDLIYKPNIIKKQAFHTSKTQVPIYREYNFKPTPHPKTILFITSKVQTHHYKWSYQLTNSSHFHKMYTYKKKKHILWFDYSL